MKIEVGQLVPEAEIAEARANRLEHAFAGQPAETVELLIGPPDLRAAEVALARRRASSARRAAADLAARGYY